MKCVLVKETELKYTTKSSPCDTIANVLFEYGIVIAHNHPGGKASPSHEDVVITDKIIEAGKLLGIDCMDHIIITINNYYSLREHDDACFE